MSHDSNLDADNDSDSDLELESSAGNLEPAALWRPTAGWKMLRFRAELLRRLRAFFQERDFLEVETPLLSHDVAVERYLQPIRAVPWGQDADEFANALDSTEDSPNIRSPDNQERIPLWLQTSPEFAMKRLMAAGGKAIYQVSKAFRSGEVGRLHNPEFTMVEWYRRSDTMTQGMKLLSDLVEATLGRGEAQLQSYQEVFEQYVYLDPHRSSIQEIRGAVTAKRLEIPESLAKEDRDGWLDLLLVECVEPHLGIEMPVIVYDYPASQSALAQLREGTPAVAERFELYVDGTELANGYHELLDPASLRERSSKVNFQRLADGAAPLPEGSLLLTAMEAGLPACCGVALGFDRLVMVATGAKQIAEVIAFPHERA